MHACSVAVGETTCCVRVGVTRARACHACEPVLRVHACLCDEATRQQSEEDNAESDAERNDGAPADLHLQ